MGADLCGWPTQNKLLLASDSVLLLLGHAPLVLCAAFCENLLEQAGPRFAGPIAILRNWTYCLFYVMAELWGSVVVSVLFWGFANQVGRH